MLSFPPPQMLMDRLMLQLALGSTLFGTLDNEGVTLTKKKKNSLYSFSHIKLSQELIKNQINKHITLKKSTKSYQFPSLALTQKTTCHSEWEKRDSMLLNRILRETWM